ncbi:hypothetical protein PF010_g4372 [Phytophthora fragariae]|uniref:Secreted protein n=1 Tax=Phytophthora fragariae TaxID=53985 RepID=A0A6A3MD81_9STRA|nr:hypothetical protein PF011_g685 [Phytophthora fragariae]KAE9128796.1 hypothetical protein PF010_g4372 [Phytophthora fragariae]KAE9253865.1 hypothetical protein PF004_g1302 [Phytophthora fragariae]KAE9362230.1 hypothetical protein PF008_g256 [Phytophthora fragariae]
MHMIVCISKSLQVLCVLLKISMRGSSNQPRSNRASLYKCIYDLFTKVLCAKHVQNYVHYTSEATATGYTVPEATFK